MPFSLFCCGGIEPYRPQRLSHEAKFSAFVSWAAFPRESQIVRDTGISTASNKPFAIQLVQQVNFGPLESKRYFVPGETGSGPFVEVSEDDLIEANFQKVNTYKNYRCSTHNKFFEVNVYQKDPVNLHHWRANLARPAREIDLQPPAANRAADALGSQSQEASAQGPVIESVLLDDTGEDDYQWSDRYLRDSSPVKDFTACDKECGYCGTCDY